MYKKKRPVYLNLFQFRFPVMAVMSAGHRISGLFLFLAFPLVLVILQLSLRSEGDFAAVLEMLSSPMVKLLLLLLIWSLAHHLLAGIRFLLIDLDLAISRQSARQSAWVVHGLEVILVIILAVTWL